MAAQFKFKYFLATAISVAWINGVDLRLTTDNQVTEVHFTSTQAHARSSGGRSGGGSFRRGSSGSRTKQTPTNSSSPSRNTSPDSSSSPSLRKSPTRNPSPRKSPNRSYDYDDDNSNRSTITSPSPRYRRNSHPGGTNVIVVPGVFDSSSSGGSAILVIFLVLIIFSVLLFLIIFTILQWLLNRERKPALSPAQKERDNDKVTVSKLQVALYSHTPEIQSQLTQLSLDIDTSSNEGLMELMRESALLLLRNSEYWSHALASSQSLDIYEAESTFNKFSIQEQSKFSSETLSNVNGKVKQKEVAAPEEEMAAYIVVTLLTGTTDDQPLFGRIHSPEELQAALEKLAALSSDYLMRFELLWSPQTENDSLTYDELLMEYTDMVQIV